MEDTGKSAVNTDFLTEKIKKRPVNRRRLLKQLAMTAALAVVFGAVACVSFIALEPRINSIMYPEEPREQMELPEELPSEEMLPEDMMTEATERQELQAEIQHELQQGLQAEIERTATETVIPEVTQSITANVTQSVTESLTEKMNAMVADAISASAQETADLLFYRNMYDSLKAAAAQAERSTVVVTGVRDSSGWLDSYETVHTTTGLITSVSDSHIYVLCTGGALEGAERIEITFPAGDDGETETARVQTAGMDTVSGYRLLRADTADLSEEVLSYIQVYRPGSSRVQTLAGEPVIAIGAPTGETGSICYGALTGGSGQIDMADADYRRLTTDIYTAENASGVLIDTNGRVLGLIDMSFNEKSLSNRLCAVGISGLEPVIRMLTEGRIKPYLGVHGVNIVVRDLLPDEAETEAEKAMEDTLSENGVYIRSIDVDSPAMYGGLRNADVIIAMDDKPVSTLQDFSSILWNWNWETSLRITVLRFDADGLTEVTVETEPVGLTEYLESREEQ